MGRHDNDYMSNADMANEKAAAAHARGLAARGGRLSPDEVGTAWARAWVDETDGLLGRVNSELHTRSFAAFFYAAGQRSMGIDEGERGDFMRGVYAGYEARRADVALNERRQARWDREQRQQTRWDEEQQELQREWAARSQPGG